MSQLGFTGFPDGASVGRPQVIIPSLSLRTIWPRIFRRSLLKRECLHRQSHQIRLEATADVFPDIEVFYNRPRRPSTLAHISPENLELTTRI